MGRPATKKIKSFILGYPSGKDIEPKNLKKYKDEAQADFETEEWCEVWACTLKEAKGMYEQTFKDWQDSQAKIHNKGTQKSPFGIGA